MASVKEVTLTVVLTVEQWSPRDTITDDDMRSNIKGGLQELFNWVDTQNSGGRLKHYHCGITEVTDESGITEVTDESGN